MLVKFLCDRRWCWLGMS